MSEEFTPTVIHGDCIRVMRTGELGDFDFVFCDPPFNIGQDYAEYVDKVQEYANWTMSWIDAVLRVTAHKGVLAFHGNDNLADMYHENMKCRMVKQLAWIIWHYRFGQCGRGNFINAHAHCRIYGFEFEQQTWNPDEILVESDRVKYGDKRVDETERGGNRTPGTVWGVPSDGPYWGRVQGNNKERRAGHPNQLPELYLERLILAYTNPGDRVLDPFGGSGTTAVVAQTLGRHCTIIEKSKKSYASILKRINEGAVRVPSRTSNA